MDFEQCFQGNNLISVQSKGIKLSQKKKRKETEQTRSVISDWLKFETSPRPQFPLQLQNGKYCIAKQVNR